MKPIVVDDLESYPVLEDVEKQLASTPLRCETQPLIDLQRYYDAKVKQCGGMPSRQDISPAEIPKLLEYIFLLELRGDPSLGPASFFYRVLGSQLANLAGQDLSQKSLAEYRCPNRRARSTMTFSYAFRNKTPTRVVGNVRDVKGKYHLVESVTFPLSNDGVNVNMLLGGIGYLDR